MLSVKLFSHLLCNYSNQSIYHNLKLKLYLYVQKIHLVIQQAVPLLKNCIIQVIFLFQVREYNSNFSHFPHKEDENLHIRI